MNVKEVNGVNSSEIYPEPVKEIRHRSVSMLVKRTDVSFTLFSTAIWRYLYFDGSWKMTYFNNHKTIDYP